jgi:hypothetical protein
VSYRLSARYVPVVLSVDLQFTLHGGQFRGPLQPRQSLAIPAKNSARSAKSNAYTRTDAERVFRAQLSQHVILDEASLPPL